MQDAGFDGPPIRLGIHFQKRRMRLSRGLRGRRAPVRECRLEFLLLLGAQLARPDHTARKDAQTSVRRRSKQDDPALPPGALYGERTDADRALLALLLHAHRKLHFVARWFF